MDTRHKKYKNIFKKNETILRDMIGNLQIIPLAPKDEYDRFVHIIISMLFEGATKSQLHSFIKKDFLLPIKNQLSDKKIDEIIDKIFICYESSKIE